MTSKLCAVAGFAALGLLAAPILTPSAWGQAQGSRQTPPPAVSQNVAPPPAKPTPPKAAPPKPATPKPAPAPIARPAPKPAAPTVTPVARPAPRPAPTPVTPTVQPTPRPPTIATTPIIAVAPGQSPVAGCTRPGQPAVPAQAAGVSLTQLDATRTAAISYFAAADAYRGCLDRFIEAERDKMFKNNTAETPELKRAAYEHSGFSEEKGRVYEAVTLFCYDWQSANQREVPGGCQLPWNPGG
jgi:outer membrane biosynthesis protein TonB